MRIAAVVFPALLIPASARAHVSEQALVLLLPTDLYITGGVLAVIASIITISLAPRAFVEKLFGYLIIPLPAMPQSLREAGSIASFILLAGIWLCGIMGPRDPLTNILPLAVWTGFWIGLLGAVGVFGNLLPVINPWSGLYRIIFGRNAKPLITLPRWLDAWPAVIGFIGFGAFYITDPAPSDPHRLGVIIAAYWVFTFAAMIVFGGETWLRRGEIFCVLFSLMARVSPIASPQNGNDETRRHAIGFPGYALLPAPPLSAALAVFALAMLGMGSFDGLKETFWWLARTGVNPLEFPGRTAVVAESLIGFLLALAALLLVFTAALRAGEAIAGIGAPIEKRIGLGEVFRSFAPALLPIALGYHISHFLIAFLVDGQYLLAAMGDPMERGMNILGLADTHITTGFLRHTTSVKAIWLTQAGCVMAGHILSVLVSHAIAMRLYETPRRAALSQIPVGAFMVFYTLFGLWLLATPRGV